MGEYQIVLSEEAYSQFRKLDRSVKKKISKAIDYLKTHDSGKRLKKFNNLFVKKIGQYRIVYVKDGEETKKVVYFIGDHKEYERWYSTFW